MTGAVRVESHVLRREPASHPHGRPGETAVPAALSVPFNLLPEGRNAEVAQLTDDDSEQGTCRRLQGHEIFRVLLHEKVPLGARGGSRGAGRLQTSPHS